MMNFTRLQKNYLFSVVDVKLFVLSIEYACCYDTKCVLTDSQ